MLDQRLIRRGFERAAAGFDEHDFLHREIRNRLLDRLQPINMDARVVVDLGAGTGAGLDGLTKRFPQATVLPVDMTAAMLRAGPAAAMGICAEATRLPLPDRSVDVIFSNLMLHHCPDPAAVFSEARRVLRDPGLLILTSLGPSSLLELGRAWATADRFSHITPFPDMHDLGDQLLRAGFSEPVVDNQTLTITYRDFDRLIADLRAAGGTNATLHRNRGLTGRAAARRLRAACLAQADEDGRIPITVDIVFGLAWSDARRVRPAPGEPIEVPVDELLGRRPDGT